MVNFPPWLCHALSSVTTIKGGQIALKNICASQHGHFLQWGWTYRSFHFLTSALDNTPEKDHAVSTLSIVDAAVCLRLTEFELVAGFRGADGGATWKPCIKNKSRGRRGGGNQQPTDGRVRGVWERGSCRKDGTGFKCAEILHCAAKYKTTAQKNKKIYCANWAEKKKRPKLQIGLWSMSRLKRRGTFTFQLRITDQSGALNIAELESVWILQPSVLNRRWCRLEPTLRS